MLSDVRCLMRQTMPLGRTLYHNCDVAVRTERGLILVQPHAHLLEQAPALDVDVDDSKVRVVVVHNEEVSAACLIKIECQVVQSVGTRVIWQRGAGDHKLHIRRTLRKTVDATALSWLT